MTQGNVEKVALGPEERDRLIRFIQDEIALTDKGTGSVVDELIAERRIEAAREALDMETPPG